MRRAIALGAVVVAIILLVLGLNSCLDARKDRAYRSYADDARALVNSSQDVSDQFFEVLSKPSRADALDVQTRVNALRVDAQQLTDRARNTDHPDELNGANGDLVDTFKFREDAIGRIAELLPTALGDKGKKAAIDLIAGQMQALLASDVIYLQRAIPELRNAYNDRGITERFPTSRFLPDLGWLDPQTVETRLGKIGTGSQQAATPGLHGTSLQKVTVQPAGTVMSEQGVNRITLSSAVLRRGGPERRRVVGDGHPGHDHDHQRQEDPGGPDDPAHRRRPGGNRQHPADREAGSRRGDEDDGRDRAGSRRVEQGQQQRHVSGGLRATVTDDLTSTVGVVALAAGGVALISLLMCIALWVRVRRLRVAQKAVLGDSGTDLVTHASRLQSNFRRCVSPFSRRSSSSTLSWPPTSSGWTGRSARPRWSATTPTTR